MKNTFKIVNGIVHIQTTDGLSILVTEEQLTRLQSLNVYWSVAFSGQLKQCKYARTKLKQDGKWLTVLMHRYLFTVPVGYVIDHLNGDGLDNRPSNIEIVTHSLNCHRRVTYYGPSKGVYINGSKWAAHICKDKVQHHLGNFNSKEEAEKAYEKASKELYKNDKLQISDVGMCIA
jgi:hypothetical protein